MKYIVFFTVLTMVMITFLLRGTFNLFLKQEFPNESIPWQAYTLQNEEASAPGDQGLQFFQERKKILVLHSYDSEMGWVKLEEQGIKDAFQNKKQALLYFDYMDTKQNITSDYLDNLYRFYEQKYRGKKYDALIVTDDAAYTFALTHRQKLFPATPIIFCGVNSFKESDIQGVPWITGIIENVDIKGTVEAALFIEPQLKKILVINDETVVGKANRALLEKVIPEISPQIQFIFLENPAMSEVLEKVASLSGDTAVLLMTFNVDRNNSIFSYEEAGNLIGEKSTVPVYCFWDFYLKCGLLGGKITSGYNQGKMAGELARKIVLEGKAPNEIPVVKTTINQYMFDYHALRKAGIKEENLPMGSVIVNKPVTFYDTYKHAIWLLALVFLILLLLVTILVINVNGRRRSEKKIRQLNKELEGQVTERTRELQNANFALRQTLNDLQQARNHLVQTEKMALLGELVAGIAHEINTPVGNSITANTYLSAKTGEFNQKFAAGQIKKSDLLAFLESCHFVNKTIFTNLERAAELIRSFKKVAVDQLVEEQRSFDLAEYVHDVLVSLRPQLRKTHHKINVICPEGIRVCWYPGAFWQVLSNLVNNSILHAYETDEVGTITITISHKPGQITILYSDDGKGMTPEVQKKIFEPFFTTRRGKGGTGLGMHIVYNLVVFKMEGIIECSSQVNGGTVFTIKLPECIKGKGEAGHA